MLVQRTTRLFTPDVRMNDRRKTSRSYDWPTLTSPTPGVSKSQNTDVLLEVGNKNMPKKKTLVKLVWSSGRGLSSKRRLTSGTSTVSLPRSQIKQRIGVSYYTVNYFESVSNPAKSQMQMKHANKTSITNSLTETGGHFWSENKQ